MGSIEKALIFPARGNWGSEAPGGVPLGERFVGVQEGDRFNDPLFVEGGAGAEENSSEEAKEGGPDFESGITGS